MTNRLPTILLCCLVLTACGVAPRAAQAPTATLVAQADSVGSYLSLEFKPTQAIARQAGKTLDQLGYLDVSHAIPPRDPSVYHATVAFFHQKLTGDQLTLLEQRFKGKQQTLKVAGWGVAGNQVAFMTVGGIEEARSFLKANGLDGSMDDPHVTIGVSREHPQDVHGVPKQAQHAFGPLQVKASYQLYLPAKGGMAPSWPLK